jgi:peroxiredoxin Q/BCP
MSEIAVGDLAPDFTLPTDGGGTVTLSALKGKSVAVYFYPKDDTSGCTSQALAFTGLAGAFEEAGAMVIGISKDGVSSHDRFKAKHGLSVVLASDADGRVCERWGVWVEKSLYGRKYMGIERATFLIGPDGRVAKTWRKVKVPGHADAVLAAARALQGAV